MNALFHFRFLRALCALCLLPAAALLFLSACSPAAVPAPVETVDVAAAQNLPEPKVVRPESHRIRANETLIEIATNYGLDYSELALWNGIADPDTIYEGEILQLSPPPSAPTVAVVAKRKAPAVTKAPVAADAPQTPSPSAKDAARGLENLPVKEGPVAAKYIYSGETLAKLRRQEKEKARKKTAPKPAQNIAVAPTITAPATPAKAKSAALLQQRRRFGVDWSWPAAGGVTEKFSERSKGINIAGKLGEPVYASANGKVVYVGTGVKSYGRLVIIKHDNDYLSAYAHNDKILVREGEKVNRGGQISTIGETGAPSPMLHFEIRKAGKPFDPLQVLPPQKR